MGRFDYGGWPQYVPVAEQRAKAAKLVNKRKKAGEAIYPVIVNGRKIAETFWGKAWCANLESYSDYENRLPRGRSYLRNGSVIDLQIDKGQINARVAGSQVYKIKIIVTPMPSEKWAVLVKICSGAIDSMIELLQGKFSKAVMSHITEPIHGLFPKPQEIKLSCSCPDWASMCKHVAAAMYGVGARLDHQPELLFRLREVDHLDLIATAGSGAFIETEANATDILDDDLSAVFGIEIDSPKKAPSKPKKPVGKKIVGKKVLAASTKAIKGKANIKNTRKKTANNSAKKSEN